VRPLRHRDERAFREPAANRTKTNIKLDCLFLSTK
jgi:hypothetical protein